MSRSLLCCALGVASIVLCALLLLLGGNDIHTNPVTIFALLFGAFAPPLLFAIGLFSAVVWPRGERSPVGAALNAIGLLAYAAVFTGGFGLLS